LSRKIAAKSPRPPRKAETITQPPSTPRGPNKATKFRLIVFSSQNSKYHLIEVGRQGVPYDCEQFDGAIGLDLILILFFLAFLAPWRLIYGF
jgi:hypothetical protein